MDYPTDNLAERITAAMKNRVKLYLEQIELCRSLLEFYFDADARWGRKMN